MSTKKKDGAQFCADMEEGYDIGIFAYAPYRLAEDRQQARKRAVRDAVREAMLSLGYSTERAEDTAEKLAAHLLVIEGPPVPTKQMVFDQIQAADDAQKSAPTNTAPAKKPDR